MGKETGIAWTQHTFNPWWGCTKVSPGCDNCYAETFDKRVHGVGKGHWGKDAPRRAFGDKHWDEPLKWNKAAEKAGKPALVFCASMADWCDVDAPPGAVERLHGLWRATPWLRWQMLTKRPSRIARNLPADWGQGYPNVWMGATVEDQERADLRIPTLLEVPAVVRFLSMEPLLGPVDLDLGRCESHDRSHLGHNHPAFGDYCTECAADGWSGELSHGHWLGDPDAGIAWVIVGGESGHGARQFHLAWARSLKAQCHGAGVPVFMKQLGALPAVSAAEAAGTWTKGDQGQRFLRLKDAKGGDMAEWPEDLRVQQFPEAP